jgi:PKD domain
VRATFSLIAALVLLALAAAPAEAVPQWLQPVTVAGPLGGTTQGDLAVAPDGTMLAISKQPVGVVSHIRARLRRPGGAFGGSIELAAANGDSPSVAVDQHGNFTAVWTEGANLRAARLAAGASAFEPAQTIGTVDPVNPDPALAVGGNGTAVIAVRQADNTVRAAIRSGAGGQFGPLSGALSGTLAIGDTFQAAVDDAGHAIIVWSRDDGTGVIRVERSERSTGGFGAAQLVSTEAPNDKSTGPVVAMAPNGRALVMWTFQNNLGPFSVKDRERNPNGTWDAIQNASPGTSQAQNPRVAMAGDGTAMAVWGFDVATVFIPQAAIRPPDGAFQALSPNLSSAGFGALAISMTRAGTATVAWTGSMSETITARRRPPGGAFGNADTVAAGTQGSATPAISVNVQALASDDQSNATLLYQRDVVGGGHDEHSLLTASFDAAAPSLVSVAVPPSATPGAGVGMAAAASDRLSTPAISWNFGDGTTGTGPAVTHSYAKEGAFTVSVAATDAAGNSTATSRTIVVASTRPKRVRTPVRALWAFNKANTWIVKLQVKRVAKGKGVRAEVRCKGKRCPFKRIKSKRVKNKKITLFKRVRTAKATTIRKRTLRPLKNRLEVRVTRPGYIGRVVRFKLVRDGIPKAKTLCLPEGTKKPAKC